jgi:hypothetical protein
MGWLQSITGFDALEEVQLEAEQRIDMLEKDMTRAKELHEAAFINMLAELETERGWRAISVTADSIRDFSDITHREISKMAWSAVMTNPVAAREIFYKTVFVSGRGLKCSSVIPEIQAVIDEFWTAKRNKIPYFFPMYVNRFNIDGEAFFVFFINKSNGHVTMREIEPQEVMEVVCDPEDSTAAVYFKRQYSLKIGSAGYATMAVKTIWYKSVDCIDNDTLLNSTKIPDDAVIAGSNDGSEGLDVYAFHFKNSLLTNRRRGLSTLTNHLPWLREFKDILRARTMINKGRSAYFLDVSIKDGTELDVKREAAKHRNPPRVGSVNVHTDRLTYQFLTPNIQGADVQSDLSEIKNMAAMGSMLPPDILGEMGKGNYQNSARTKFPFLRSMEFQQELWEFALKYGVMWVVVWAANKYGKLPKSFKVAKKVNISQLSLTQEGELYNTDTGAVLSKKTTRLVRDHMRNIYEAVGAAVQNTPTGSPTMPPPPGMPPGPIPGGDPAKADSAMNDYMIITMSDEIDAVDLVEVSFPRIDTENLADMAGAFQVFDGMKIVSKQTLAKLAGFDYNKEKELMDGEAAEAMHKMEQEQNRLASMGVPPPPVDPTTGEPMSPGAPPPGGGGMLPQGGFTNSASNIQSVLADVLASKGRKDKRGAQVKESDIVPRILSRRLFEEFLTNETD